jgi:hypothetical protein
LSVEAKGDTTIAKSARSHCEKYKDVHGRRHLLTDRRQAVPVSINTAEDQWGGVTPIVRWGRKTKKRKRSTRFLPSLSYSVRSTKPQNSMATTRKLDAKSHQTMFPRRCIIPLRCIRFNHIRIVNCCSVFSQPFFYLSFTKKHST